MTHYSIGIIFLKCDSVAHSYLNWDADPPHPPDLGVGPVSS
jgi:hypothetical protein